MAQAFPRGARFADPVVFGAVPAGFYRVTLPLFAEGRTKAEDKLKYDSNTGMHIEAVARITDKRYLDEKWGGDPEGLVGMSIFTPNDFIIGLLDSPGPVDAGGQLADPDDWLKTGQGRGGPLFNNMLEAAGVEGDDVDEICAAMEGRTVIVQVRVERDQTETYPDKNRIVKFFPLPEEEKPKPASASARPTAPAARPAPAAVARPAALAGRPAAQPAARPAAAPVRTAPAPARATAAPVEPMVNCDVCEIDGKPGTHTYEEGGNLVPRAGLRKHLLEAHPEPA